MKKLYSISLIAFFMMAFAFNHAYAQYCTPSTSTTWFYNQTAKTSGAVGNFNNSTGAAQGVFDYTLTHGATVTPGASFKLTVNYYYGMGVWVDWNNDGTFANSGTERIYVRTNNKYAWGDQDITVNVPTTAVQGTKLRMRIMSGYYWQMQPCGNFTYASDVEDYYVFVTFDNNAGMEQFTSPIAECNGTAGNSLDIVFKNSGVNDLDTLYFGGEIRDRNGVITTTIPQKMWTGNLTTGQTSNPFNLYSYSSGFRGGDTVCVWSFDPNNVPDSARNDDTLCYVVLKGIDGTFTVGDTTAGAHDFRTLMDALNFVDAAGAICDSLIIELHDTSWASYYGQHELSNILGTSPTAPIIIRPEAHNMYDTRVWFDSCTEDYNYGFLIEGVTDVYIEGIDFSTSNTKSSNFARVFDINDAERIHFMDCSFQNNRNNTSNTDFDLITISGVDEATFDDCDFYQGANSINASNGSDLGVYDCNFWDMYQRSIFMTEYDGLDIIGSKFWSTTLIANGNAIQLTKVNSDVEISYNTIEIRNGQWPLNGLLMDECNALNASIEIYNNNFNLGQPWSGARYRAVSMTDVVGASLVFNTFAVSGNNNSNAAIYSDNGTRNTVYNNNLAALVAGYSIHTPQAASVISGDHNNLYAGNGTIGRMGSTDHQSLTAWRNATGLDAHSVSVNPFFHAVQNNDLHVCNDKLYGAATPIAGITDDWEGDLRDPSTPCIGADEFAPVSLFSLGNDYGLCNGDSTDLVAGKGLTGEIAIWKDRGTGNVLDTGQVFTATTPGKYEVTLLNACGVNVDSIEIISPAQVSLMPDTNICPGLTVDVDATIINDDQYMWSNGATTAKITVTSQGVYHVTTTDAWSCISVDSIEVTYSNSANLSTQNDTIVCEGQAFGLFGGTDPATNPSARYRWFGFINAGQETGSNIFVDYDLLTSDDTTIVCELTHRGCVTTDSLRVQKKPAPAIVNLVITDNGRGFYVNSNNSTGEDHHWDFGDSTSSSWDSPRHLYNANGKYTVTYTNSNICGAVDTSFEITIARLSILNNGIASKVNIYPNPSNGQFTIDFADVNADALSVRIIDAQGRTVYNNDLGAVLGSTTESIDLGNVGAGMYVVQITMDGNVSNARVTVK